MSAPDRTRVVFVTTVFDVVDTGPATYANYLWSALRDDPSIDFHVVAPSFAETHSRLHPSGAGRGSLGLYRCVQDEARRIANTLGPCIVHGNSTHSMARLIGIRMPIVIQVNDYETATFPARAGHVLLAQGPRRTAAFAWRNWNERRVLRRADRVLCNSQFTAQVVGNAYDLSRARLAVMHKGVDTEVFRRPGTLPVDPTPQLPRGSRLLFVGSDWRRKGLDVLLEAFSAVAARFDEATLTVVGPDTTDEKLLACLDGHPARDRILLIGRASRATVAELLWQADIFVLPSRREALGVAVLEALAAGVPVVASTAGGIPEIARAGKDALLVAPGDADELTAAILTLFEQPILRQALRVQGPKRAEEFSVASMTGRVRELYQAIAQEDARLQ